jgi:tRNA threonylcarbamoyladenosine biosynthesis protein TsaB
LIRSDRPVLAIETSSSRPGAAIAAFAPAGENAVRILAARYVDGAPSRGETLADCIRELLESARIEVRDLAALGVVRGPGSYTGIRVGLSLARGLALADGIPVVGIGSLELMALAGKRVNGTVGCVRRASGRQFYAALYAWRGARAHETCEPCVIDWDAAVAWLEAGRPSTVYSDRESVDSLRELLRSKSDIEVEQAAPEVAEALARATLVRFEARGGERASEVLPLYVSAVNARPNRNRVAVVELSGE